MYLGMLVIAEMAVCLVLGAIQVFIGNVILVESGILALTAGLLSHHLWNVHPAIALVIGIGIFILSYIIQHTKVGMWTLGIIMSFLWAVIFAVIAHDIPGSDMVWTHVTFLISFILVIGLHIYARDN